MTSSNQIKKEKNLTASVQSDKPSVKCTNINKRFGREHALKNINMTVHRGQLVTVLAPEFSGKTTLAKIMCGLVPPTKGQVLIRGKKAGHRTNAIVSYLPEIPFVKYDSTVFDLLNIYGRFFEDFRNKKAYKLLKNFKINPKTKFENMSTTAIQIVETIVVASRKTALYIFDDPIVNVNEKYKQDILDIIEKCKKDGAVVVLSQEANGLDEITDRVFFLDHGEVMLSSTKEEIQKKYFQPISRVYKEVYKK